MGSLSDKEEIEKVKQELREHYDVKTMKEIEYIGDQDGESGESGERDLSFSESIYHTNA